MNEDYVSSKNQTKKLLQRRIRIFYYIVPLNNKNLLLIQELVRVLIFDQMTTSKKTFFL